MPARIFDWSTFPKKKAQKTLLTEPKKKAAPKKTMVKKTKKKMR